MTATLAPTDVAGFNAQVEAGRAQAEQHLQAMEAAYLALIRKVGRDASTNLRAITAAADWQLPPEGILFSLAAIAPVALQKMKRLHRDVLKAAAEPPLVRVGISFDIHHPITADMLEQAGQRTGVALGEAVQPVLRQTIAEAYMQGLSVVDAADLILDRIDQAAPAQAAMLARTDLNGLSNGGSVMAARMVGVAFKSWLTAGDEKVREAHANADGQTVPVDQPFLVGGEQLAYPGDPNGSDGEVCNCRCTVIYTDSLTSGGEMISDSYVRLRASSHPFTAAATPVRWEAVLAVEGEPTEDGRLLAPGSITWRDLPISLMAQTETADGHDGAGVAGRIDQIWRDGNRIMGAGVFDPGEYGTEIARLVQDQTLRGVSIDLAIREFEVMVLGEDGQPTGQDLELAGVEADAVFVVTDGVIGAATVCSFQAIANATITIVGSGNDQWRATRDGEFRFTGPTANDETRVALARLASAATARSEQVDAEKRDLLATIDRATAQLLTPEGAAE